ncbi:sulfatase-like hydrolase/transferase [Candidatus Margulisiibacteriota bacterium]
MAEKNNKEYLLNLNKVNKTSLVSKKSVILIVVDALRADHMGIYGYSRNTTPFLTKLSKENKLNKINIAFSASSSSFAGILSILNAKEWNSIRLNNLSVIDIMKNLGYSTNLILSGDFKNFYNLKLFLGNNISYFYDGTYSKKHPINSDKAIFEGLENIPKNTDQPAFMYFHLMSVHSGGTVFKEFHKYTPFKSHPFNSKKERAKKYVNNYDNGILQADSFINKIFSQLEQKGYLKNSIVIITSDHGEFLGKNNTYGHTQYIYNDVIQIPLIFFGIKNSIPHNLPYATQADIMPTVLDYLALPIPKSWEGKSLLEAVTKKESYHEEIDNYYSVIEHKNNHFLKYIYDKKKGEEEIYDLNKDLKETNNLIKYYDREILKNLRNKAQLKFNLIIKEVE